MFVLAGANVARSGSDTTSPRAVLDQLQLASRDGIGQRERQLVAHLIESRRRLRHDHPDVRYRRGFDVRASSPSNAERIDDAAGASLSASTVDTAYIVTNSAKSSVTKSAYDSSQRSCPPPR